MSTSLRLNILAFTHKNIFLNELGKLVLEKEAVLAKLSNIKNHISLDIREIFYLSTCNRVEFVFACEKDLDKEQVGLFLSLFYSEFTHGQIEALVPFANLYQGDEALQHLLMVSSSLDSMVIGEREISRQLRQAYEECALFGLTGDFLRIVMKQTIKTSKEVYTHTRIAEKPISVASLAVRSLLDKDLPSSAKILMIGAGETNHLMAKYLQKAEFTHFQVFNRSLEKAQSLALELNGTAHPLDHLGATSLDFDILISCTGSSQALIHKPTWDAITAQNPEKHRFIIDLAVPNDIAEDIQTLPGVTYISVSSLKAEVENNLRFREQEMENAMALVFQGMEEFKEINRIRNVERAFGELPHRIKAIREKTVSEVFSKELAKVDEDTRDLIDRMLGYMEKKCISVPIVIAKEILLSEESRLN